VPGSRGRAQAPTPPPGRRAPKRQWDTIIVGGGPAGLAAAVVLGRARRAVLVIDAGSPRNAAARGVHAFLTRDGISPHELRTLGRREARRYGAVVRRGVVSAARRLKRGFVVTLEGGAELRSRTLLLATGVSDRLPEVAGLRELYGVSVHHCPYCDGWEERDRRIAVWGRGRAGFELARKMLGWTADVMLLSDGPSGLRRALRVELEALGIPLREARIARLEGRKGRLRRVVFEDGSAIPRDALFFTNGFDQCSSLPRDFHCAFTRTGVVRTGKGEHTGTEGLYVAGDASHDSQFVVVAASEGVRAAVRIHQALAAEDEKAWIARRRAPGG
jgi:thioredoxin reductase